MVVNDYRSDLDPYSYSYSWDAYVGRQIGHKTARELQEYQAKLYVGGRSVRTVMDVERAMLSLTPGKNRSLMEQLLWDDKIKKRHSARVRQSLRATSPAATAEQSWAGYVIKVRYQTREDRQLYKDFLWMSGYWGASAESLFPNGVPPFREYVQVNEEFDKRFNIKGATINNTDIHVKEIYGAYGRRSK